MNSIAKQALWYKRIAIDKQDKARRWAHDIDYATQCYHDYGTYIAKHDVLMDTLPTYTVPLCG